MQYAIQEKDVAAEPVVSVRKHTSLDQMGSTMAESMHALESTIAPRGAWTARAPFAVYHNTPFRPDDIDMEVGVPVRRESLADLKSAGLFAHELPAGHVAFTIHEGSYGAIGAAYQALFEWTRAHGKRPAGPPREIYIVGPGMAKDARDYRTEIDLPIL
jgi:effector-binding domain-containing protein